MILALIPIFGLGIGHFYIGKYRKAFFYLIAPWLMHFMSTHVVVNEHFYMFSILFILLLYVYAIIDVWRAFPLNTMLSLKYSRWYFVLLFTILNYVVIVVYIMYFNNNERKIGHFISPTSSMNHSILKGDILVIKKRSEIKHNDVVIFHYPPRPEAFFLKRLVAIGGDEVMYVHKKVYVHFSQGDSYIEEHYAKEHIKKYRNKLWVENPYMINNKNIYYDDKTKRTAFQHLLARENAMEAIYLDDENLKSYENGEGRKINAFYFKVSSKHYFMLGDNRANSADSRFWGEVDERFIYGVPSLVYFNIYDFSRWGISL
jgi:signal peptidase I